MMMMPHSFNIIWTPSHAHPLKGFQAETEEPPAISEPGASTKTKTKAVKEASLSQVWLRLTGICVKYHLHICGLICLMVFL